MSEVEPLPYIMRSSVDQSQNLNFTLEGEDFFFEIPISFGGKAINADLITCFRWSIPVPPELAPALPRAIVVTPRKDGHIPDFGFVAQLGSSFVVSERFVELMSQIDPEAQQFLPIAETVDRSGAVLGTKFYLMNVLTRLEAIDVGSSTVEWKTTSDGGVPYLNYIPGASRDRRLVLLERVVKGHSLWRGSLNQFPALHFCSDNLKEAMEAARLSELQLQYVGTN